MTLTQFFSGYPTIQVLCQDKAVTVVIPAREAIPTGFSTIIFCMCNHLDKSKKYDSLSIELQFPSAGIPIQRLCPKERHFTLIPESNKIRAVTQFTL